MRTLIPAVVAVLALAGSASAQGVVNVDVTKLAGRGMDSVCHKAADDDQTAFDLSVEMVPLARLGEAGSGAREVRVGPYGYTGRGVRVTSADPRFGEITVDPAESMPRLPQGPSLSLANLVWAQEGGRCRLAPAPGRREIPPGALRAADVGAAPVLAGYRPGASWPSTGQGRFIGLMHPEAGGDRTAIVTFAAGAEHATVVQAVLPFAFQAISTLPGLHSLRWSVRLIGRQSDGALVELVLWADPKDGGLP